MEMVMTMLFDSFMPKMIPSIWASIMDHHTDDQSHRGGTTDHRFRSVIMEQPTSTRTPHGTEALMRSERRIVRRWNSVVGGMLAGAAAWRCWAFVAVKFGWAGTLAL
jgi:hypothetical protein